MVGRGYHMQQRRHLSPARVRLDHVGPLRKFLSAATSAGVHFTPSALVFDQPAVLVPLTAYLRASGTLDAPASFRSLSSAGTTSSAYTFLLLVTAERFKGVADVSDILVYQLMLHGARMQAVSEQAECIRGVLFYCAARVRFNLKRQQLRCTTVPLNLDILQAAVVSAVTCASRLLSLSVIPIPITPQTDPCLAKLCKALRQPAMLSVLEMLGRFDEHSRLVPCPSMGSRIDLITALCFSVMWVMLWSAGQGDGTSESTRACLSALGTLRKRLRMLSGLASAWRDSVTSVTDYPEVEDICKLERGLRFLTTAEHLHRQANAGICTHPAVMSLIYQGIMLQLHIMYTLAPDILALSPTNTTEDWQPLLDGVSLLLTEWERWRLQGCKDCVDLDGLSELQHMRRASPCLLCGRRIFCQTTSCVNYRRHLEQQCTGTGVASDSVFQPCT